MSPWIVFLISAAAVVLAGMRLSRDGDALAERTGLGRVWVGAILVAGATSLPELATDVYAVRAGERNLAVGDLFGSNMANMLILAVADLSVRQTPILERVAANQLLVGTLGIILSAMAGVAILLPGHYQTFGIGWATVAIGVVYVLGMRLLSVNRREPAFETAAQAEAHLRRTPSLRECVMGFLIASAVLLLAARFLASSAAQIAGELGIASGFVGMVLLALTTSLPEVSVSLFTVRQGSYDLAVGNLLGSNAFNMAILVALDVADGPRSLLSGLDPSLLLGGLIGILMMGQVLMGIANRSEKRVWYLEPDAVFLVLTYVLGLTLVYKTGGH